MGRDLSVEIKPMLTREQREPILETLRQFADEDYSVWYSPIARNNCILICGNPWPGEHSVTGFFAGLDTTQVQYIEDVLAVSNDGRLWAYDSEIYEGICLTAQSCVVRGLDLNPRSAKIMRAFCAPRSASFRHETGGAR